MQAHADAVRRAFVARARNHERGPVEGALWVQIGVRQEARPDLDQARVDGLEVVARDTYAIVEFDRW